MPIQIEDRSLMTGQQCCVARALLGISKRELATRAGVEPQLLRDFEERQADIPAEVARALQAALEQAGVEFIATANGGEGVRLRPAHLATPQPHYLH